jgi:hypothetical protein
MNRRRYPNFFKDKAATRFLSTRRFCSTGPRLITPDVEEEIEALLIGLHEQTIYGNSQTP